jgi:hypothetical protein
MKSLVILLAAALTTPTVAFAAGEDEAIAIVKNWRGEGYYMSVGQAVDGLLMGFEAEGHAVQPVAWDATETLPGHYDVRYSFLLDAASAEMIFLFDKDEGRVSPANDMARAAVTLAASVDIGEAPTAPTKAKPGGPRTAESSKKFTRITSTFTLTRAVNSKSGSPSWRRGTSPPSKSSNRP